MFRNNVQSGLFSILYSIGSKPLQIWDKKVRNGHIKRITDNDIQSLVLEMEGTNVSTTYITCPADPSKTLGIKLPIVNMTIKNLKKYFMFEVQVLDDKNVRRRFKASSYRFTTRVKPFVCTMPLRLDDGWNQIQFNLADFTRRAYGTNYIETLRVQIHANCCIRRVYFSDRLYSQDELPADFKLYLPVKKKEKVSECSQGMSTVSGVSACNGPELSLGTEVELVTGTELEPDTSTELNTGLGLGTSTELGTKLELGTNTELGTRLELGTSKELGMRLETGTSMKLELDMSMELEPSP